MTKRNAKKVRRNYKIEKSSRQFAKQNGSNESSGSHMRHREVELDPRYGTKDDNFLNTEGDFYNFTMAALHVPKKSFLNFIDNKTSHFWLRKFRRDLTDSTKIFLSRQFLEVAIELSFSYPKYIAKMIPNAIPPLDNIWIEWNELDRFEATKKVLEKLDISFANEEAAQKSDTGYLIRKSPSGGFEYSCVFPDVRPVINGIRREKKQPKLFFPALSWHLNNDPKEPFTTAKMNALRLPQGLPFVDHAVDEKNRLTILAALWGNDYLHVHKDRTDETINMLERWTYNVQTGIHDLGYCTYPELYTDREDARFAKNADQIHLGDMRLLTAVFSLLNYPRIIRERPQAPKKMRSIRWGRPMPKNEVKVIEVDLPKRRGVTMYQKLFTGQGSPKRQHWRRRHPRTLVDANGKVKKIIWIEPMLVGNPELGVIEHEYFLKAKNDKYQKPKGAS